MDPKRLNRLVWVTVAGLTLVAVITLLSRNAPVGKSPTLGGDPGAAPPVLKDARPGGKLDPTHIGTSGEGVIQQVNSKTGELQKVFRYRTLTPREQGVFDLASPQAWLYLSPTRVLHLRSEEGQFVAPANQPQSGEFRKNVVLTLFQTAAPRKLAPLDETSPDRAMRIEMDDASFDTTLGMISTQNRVMLTTPVTQQVRFEGKGLSLVYNDQNRRIERLEITQGKSLVYRPASPKPGDEVPRIPAGAPTPAVPPTPGAKPKPAQELQYYRVLFERSVHVKSEDRTIDADQLVVFLTLEKPSDSDAASPAAVPPKAERDNTASPTDPLTQLALERIVAALPLLIAQVGAPIPAPAKPQPLAPNPSPLNLGKEITLTWSGKMVMTPIEARPQELLTPQDTLLSFEGSPVAVNLGHDDRLVCSILLYLDSAKQVDAIGSAEFPMRLTSPSLGVVTAPELLVWTEKNTGELRGPGTITAPEVAAAVPTAAGAKPVKRTGLPPGFKVAWSEGVDLKFIKDTGKSDSRIDTIIFRGAVKVEDTQMTVQANQLAAHFIKPGDEVRRIPAGSPAAASQSDAAQISRIDAAGDVVAVHKNGRVESQELHLDLAPDTDGKVAPTRMTARGKVRVIDPQQQMDAGALDIAFAAPSKTAAPRPAPANPGDADAMARDIKTVTATENFELRLRGGSIVRGVKLIADNITGNAELFGAAGSPVTVTQPAAAPAPGAPAKAAHDSQLTVDHLTMENHGKLAHSSGPGKFTFTEADERSAKDPAVVIPGKHIRVNWTDKMLFEDAANTLQVFGNVVAESEDSPQELNRLTAAQVTLDLTSPPVKPIVAPGAVAQPLAAKPGPDAAMDRRQLRLMTAKQNVVLLSTKWADDTHQKVLTRLRISGETLTYQNETSIAQVPGPGSMLLEDYRPSTKPAAPANPQPPAAALQKRPAAMSGRGATLFTWTTQLTLDRGHSQMTIEGGTHMTHRPSENAGLMELECDKLVADTETDKSKVFLGGVEENLKLKQILADGRVQVRDHIGLPDERMITAAKLLYTGADQTVLLTASPGRKVTISRNDQPKPLNAAVILWNLKADTLEVRDAGL